MNETDVSPFQNQWEVYFLSASPVIQQQPPRLQCLSLQSEWCDRALLLCGVLKGSVWSVQLLLEWGGCEEGSTSVSEAKPVPVNSLALFNPAPWFLSCKWKDPGLGLLDKHPKHHQSLHQSANSCYHFFPPKFFPFPSLILIQKKPAVP